MMESPVRNRFPPQSLPGATRRRPRDKRRAKRRVSVRTAASLLALSAVASAIAAYDAHARATVREEQSGAGVGDELMVRFAGGRGGDGGRGRYVRARRSGTDAEADAHADAEAGAGAGLGSGSEESPRRCEYEGHCPELTTCAYDPASSTELGGVCEPYLPEAEAEVEPPGECASACLRDLELDERFYLKTRPIVNGTVRARASRRRPGGCVVFFERQWGAFGEDFAVEQWEAAKKGAIVRVDPVLKTSLSGAPLWWEDPMWAALCYDPCQMDGEEGKDGCFPSSDGGMGESPFFCDGGHCHRRRKWAPKPKPQKHGFKEELVVVIAASSNFFKSLANEAASLRYWAPNNGLVVYDLGLQPDQVEEVKNWSNVISLEWEGGVPDTYPPHVHECRKYAWKPIIINETLHKYGKVFYTDAGSAITGPLDPLERILEQTGVFLVWGQDHDMTDRGGKKGTYSYLNVDKKYYTGRPSFAGGIQGHLLPSRYVDTIVRPNAECAMVKTCIDPPKETSVHHKFDQLTLSILAHRPHVMPRHHTEYLASSKKQLNPDLSLPSKRIIWTARQNGHYYTTNEKKLMLRQNSSVR